MGLIVDSVKDYAIIMIDLNRYVLSWNVGAKAIFGYTEEEIIGKCYLEILLPPRIIITKYPNRKYKQPYR